MILNEVSKSELINQSKAYAKGRERFDKRKLSKVIDTVESLNQVDMDKFFKEDILTFDLNVQGETDKYKVKVTLLNVLEYLEDAIKKTGTLTYREVARALLKSFNGKDIYVSCNCPDHRYRFSFWGTKKGYNSGSPELRPADITNPKDSLGSSCKHTLLVLNNTSWLQRLARVIINYIDYMKDHYEKLYADLMYPKLYGKEYEKDVQLSFDETPEEDTIDKANIEKKKSTQFQKGNQSGVQFAPKEDENQITFEENEDDII